MKRILILLLFFSSARVYSQQLFSLRLVPSVLTSAPAVHSGAFGAYDQKWFFIGGRKNGLHGFQSPFAFPQNKINDKIYITDPISDQSLVKAKRGCLCIVPYETKD